MKEKNKVYSQLTEAIRLANYNIFDYRRISLILFDNIVEYLLNLQVYFAIRRDRENKNFTIDKRKRIIKSLNRFENITKYANEYEIINEKEKPVLNYCHKARNNVYHNFREDERITDCCLFILSKFLFNNNERLLVTGIIELSDTLLENQKMILKIGNLKSYEEALIKLKDFYSNNIQPAEIFSQILIGELMELIEFQECDANEDWDEFNTIIRGQYFWDVSYKKEKEKKNQLDLDFFISDFKKNWQDLNQSQIDRYKQKALRLKELPTNDSFEKFITIKDRLYPFYLGMKYYIAEQEYKADLS